MPFLKTHNTTQIFIDENGIFFTKTGDQPDLTSPDIASLQKRIDAIDKAKNQRPTMTLPFIVLDLHKPRHYPLTAIGINASTGKLRTKPKTSYDPYSPFIPKALWNHSIEALANEYYHLHQKTRIARDRLTQALGPISLNMAKFVSRWHQDLDIIIQREAALKSAYDSLVDTKTPISKENE
jgi:hypothetical protein